jgi:hypothetical protein
MPPATMQVLSVADAATVLGIAPRTVRRWLPEGQLVGRKIVTSWVVLCPAERAISRHWSGGTILYQQAQPTPTAMRQRLRQLGQWLITVGNAIGGAHRTRGEVFLT